jgi:hypothetical protein
MFPLWRYVTRTLIKQLAIIIKICCTSNTGVVPIINKLDVITDVILARDTNLNKYKMIKNIASGTKK